VWNDLPGEMKAAHTLDEFVERDCEYHWRTGRFFPFTSRFSFSPAGFPKIPVPQPARHRLERMIPATLRAYFLSG